MGRRQIFVQVLTGFAAVQNIIPKTRVIQLVGDIGGYAGTEITEGVDRRRLVVGFDIHFQGMQPANDVLPEQPFGVALGGLGIRLVGHVIFITAGEKNGLATAHFAQRCQKTIGRAVTGKRRVSLIITIARLLNCP